MFKHWHRTLVLLSAALAAGQLGIGVCTAGKPGTPPDPPGPGTICFRESFVTADGINAQNVWEMNSDGSDRGLSHMRAATDVEEPSYLTYGGFRWWLTLVDDMVNGCDLYAFRPDDAGDLIWVQLTDVARDDIELLGDLTRALGP